MSHRLLLLALLLVGATPAATLAPGSTLAPLTLNDQHDAPLTIGPPIRLLLFTRDMDAGDLVKEALAEHAPLLDAAHAVYVSDIGGMPALIARLFALPAMRKRPYRMLLDRDGAATAAIPSEKGKVTVLHLADLRVESIDYLDSAAAVRAALAPPAP